MRPQAPLNTIAGLTTAVFDTGRRGNPRPGCDCEQCFGYCMVDGDKAQRENFAGGLGAAPRSPTAALDFDA